MTGVARMLYALVNPLAIHRTETTYNRPVNATDLNAADFIVHPDEIVATSLVQLNPTTILVQYPTDINESTEQEYTGAAPNFQTPDEVTMQFL